MADQTPTSAQPAAPAPLSFLEKLQAPADVLWKEYRVFFIVFGILVLIVKFREVIISLLVDSGKQAVDSATKQDAQLKSQENQANDQANQLRQEANALPKDNSKVDEDWNKK